VSSLLASTISPETGAYTSLTALTLSPLPTESPCAIVLPTSSSFDEEVVAERLLCVVRDADHDGVALQLRPLVRLGVVQVVQNGGSGVGSADALEERRRWT
jgi:hypothetical protein